VSRSAIQIGEIEGDVYTTRRSRSPLLFVHGVNETAKDSLDLRPAAEAFAESGFRVTVPDFVRLRRQNVTPEDVNDIVRVILSLTL
jgi:hypothetical protein